jgi:hypothetical protein
VGGEALQKAVIARLDRAAKRSQVKRSQMLQLQDGITSQLPILALSILGPTFAGRDGELAFGEEIDE